MAEGHSHGLDETISARIAVCDRGRVERVPTYCRPVPLEVGTHRRVRFSFRHTVGVASRPWLVWPCSYPMDDGLGSIFGRLVDSRCALFMLYLASIRWPQNDFASSL